MKCTVCDSENTEVCFKGSHPSWYPGMGGKPEHIAVCRDCCTAFRVDKPMDENREKGYFEFGNDRSLPQLYKRFGDYFLQNSHEKLWIQEKARSFFGRNSLSILDIGSKSGGFGYLFKLDGHSVRMIEPTKIFAEFTNDRLHIPTMCGFYTVDSYGAGEFDFLIAGGLIHRIDPPSNFFLAASKHLKSGGYLYAREYNLLRLDASCFEWGLHRNWISKMGLIQLAAKYGFEFCNSINWEDLGAAVPENTKSTVGYLFRYTGVKSSVVALHDYSCRDVCLSVTATIFGVGIFNSFQQTKSRASILYTINNIFGSVATYYLIGLPLRVIERFSRFAKRQLR